MDSIHYEDNQGFTVLDDIQLSLAEKKIYGFVSTDEYLQTSLAQLLAGFYLPTAGEIHYGSETIKSYDRQVGHRHIFRKIGYVPKDVVASFLYPTVYEELAAPIPVSLPRTGIGKTPFGCFKNGVTTERVPFPRSLYLKSWRAKEVEISSFINL